MRKNYFTITFLFLVVATSAQITPFLAGRFQHTLDSVCSKYKMKGASVAVLIPNIGVWKGVYGESEAGVPITSDMYFGMGSNTKTHIVAALLKMQEQNLLSLDDTIGEWIQGYPNISGQITIRQCLNHTSGLYDYMHNDAINDSIFSNPSKIWTREQILHLVAAPNSAPGVTWDYSNTNYIIAGIIIEKVLNKSPYEAIHDLVLAPSGLSHTYNFGETGSANYAHPWSMSMDGNVLTDMTTTPILNHLFSLANTAGSLMTTAEDNVQFWHKLWNKQIISQQSWNEMVQLEDLGSNDGYGLGIFMYSRKMNGRTFYTHGGTFFGYINENMVDTTSGVTIAVLTNQDSVNNNGLMSLVVRALHKITLNMPATGIGETNANRHNFYVYPNPSSGIVNIAGATGNEYLFADITGKTMQQGVISESGIDVSSLPSGMYFILVKDESGTVLQTQRVQIVQD